MSLADAPLARQIRRRSGRLGLGTRFQVRSDDLAIPRPCIDPLQTSLGPGRSLPEFFLVHGSHRGWKTRCHGSRRRPSSGRSCSPSGRYTPCTTCSGGSRTCVYTSFYAFFVSNMERAPRRRCTRACYETTNDGRRRCGSAQTTSQSPSANVRCMSEFNPSRRTPRTHQVRQGAHSMPFEPRTTCPPPWSGLHPYMLRDA